LQEDIKALQTELGAKNKTINEMKTINSQMTEKIKKSKEVMEEGNELTKVCILF
jgi:hypothetical protein